MGRWVTSKGRRVYIPDEGEENPFARRDDDISIRKSAGKTWVAHKSEKGKKAGVRDLDKPFDTEEDALKYADTIEGKGQEDREPKNQIDKDADTKEKQIAKNKAEADERNMPSHSQEQLGKYNKYKQDVYYKRAKEVNVNGNTYKVWSDPIYKGTFAEDSKGNVLPISGSGYLSKELSQRKAIANKFGESTFRKKKK